MTEGKSSVRSDLAFSGFLAVFFAYLILAAQQWSYRTALFPEVIGAAGLVSLAVLLLLRVVLRKSPVIQARRVTHEDEVPVSPAAKATSNGQEARISVRFVAWLLGAVMLAVLIGQLWALPVLVLLFLRYEADESWRLSLLATGTIWVFLYGVFELLLRITWLQGVLWRLI